jgi:hypothetical protein
LGDIFGTLLIIDPCCKNKVRFSQVLGISFNLVYDKRNLYFTGAFMHISLDSGQFSLLCFGAFFLLFFVVLVFAVISSANRKKTVIEAARLSGFTPDANPDPAFVEELKNVFAPSRLIRVKNAFKRSFGDETLYLFDSFIENTSSNRSEHETALEPGNLAVFSPHLNLPRFYMVSRLPLPGFLGPMMNNLLESEIARMGFTNYQNVPPDFDAKYSLYIDDETRAEQVFKESTLLRLAQMEQLNLRGQGRILVLNRKDLGQGSTFDAARLAGFVGQARAVCDLLMF